ncbi:DUF4407 domain-containing protein [Actinoplanes sp. NPDC049548]|uniref:DUF4407 domain-containing protein n=1 Tax=Actinoplanes sp. NPDC049548 TaxID=3155152 RepID=UPI003438E66E
MRRFTLWLSGADPAILRDCTALSNTELIRFGGLGALTLIPAIMGTFSMAYAVSTLTGNLWLYILAGLAWGVVVLLIDRYLVSTLHKSSVQGRGRTVPITARLLFAVVVGIAVAHPLVLLWFDDSISQTIAENRRDAVAARQQQADRDVAALPKAPALIPVLESQRATRLETLDCLRRLKTYEQSNVQKALPCGISSGSPDCGPRCQDLARQITAVQREITALDGQIAKARTGDGTAAGRYEAEVERVRTKAAADIRDIETRFSSDYLARVAALDQLKERSSHVLVVELFLIGFFVLVDILPVIMKITTPAGEYEQVRDTRLVEAIATQQARRATVGEIEAAVAKANADAERVLAEMAAVTRVPLDMLRARERHIELFEHRVRLLRQSSSGIDEAITESDILRFRDLDRQSMIRAMTRTQEFMKQS